MWHKYSLGIEQDWLLSYVHKKHYNLFSFNMFDLRPAQQQIFLLENLPARAC